MPDQNYTGIGCFARPQRLSLIFKKLIQSYTLGPVTGKQLLDGPLSREMRDTDLLQTLMAGQSRDSSPEKCHPTPNRIMLRITGFYLSLNENKLNLSIFARTNRSRPEIITTSLDGLTKLRRKRLH